MANAKETQKEQAKEIKLEFVRMCQRKNAEMEYLSRERKERQRNTISTVLLIVICVFMIVAIYHSNANVQDNEGGRNYTTEIQTEPERVYPTEIVCKVVEVNESENIVTVEYNGQRYDFYGNDFLVGETIVCKFTDNMEIVDAER
jgi:hypothetical protein